MATARSDCQRTISPVSIGECPDVLVMTRFLSVKSTACPARDRYSSSSSERQQIVNCHSGSPRSLIRQSGRVAARLRNAAIAEPHVNGAACTATATRQVEVSDRGSVTAAVDSRAVSRASLGDCPDVLGIPPVLSITSTAHAPRSLLVKWQ